MNTRPRMFITGFITSIAIGLVVAREIPHKGDSSTSETYLEWIRNYKQHAASLPVQKGSPGVSHGTSVQTAARLHELLQLSKQSQGTSHQGRHKRSARRRHVRDPPDDETPPTTTVSPPTDSTTTPSDGSRPGDPEPAPYDDLHERWEDAVKAKIIDGRVARPNRWEWAVALNTEQYDMGFVCGGTIIDLRWVVTAAHCVYSVREIGPLYAWIGAWNLTTHDYKDSVLVQDIIVHPSYVMFGSSLYDIALLKLTRAANVSATPDNILTLPDPLLNLFEMNPFCFIIGWGAYEAEHTDVMSTVLLERWVNVISYVECQTRWESGFVPVEIAASNICIDEGVDGDVSACLGDSGSPLQCFDTTDNVWKLAGLSSWGSGACSTFPSVYTKVSAFLDWIYATMYPANGIRRPMAK